MLVAATDGPKVRIPPARESSYHSNCRVLSCKAVFVDTDAVPAKDSRVGDLIQNEVEAALVYQTAEALIKGGVDQEQIGIISLYRQQIKCISHLLKGYEKLDILTADRSQGRDKDCIIISLVRANDDNQVRFLNECILAAPLTRCYDVDW